MPLLSVPGQISAGVIDGFRRDDAGDGTLGLPDYSLVPYTYAPLLGVTDSSPQWVITQDVTSEMSAFKGVADGFGALRSVSSPRGGFETWMVSMPSGSSASGLTGVRSPDTMWGPDDFAFALRHPGVQEWDPSSVRTYLAFSKADNTVGMRLTTSAAEGPWDAEKADSAPVAIGSQTDMWNGGSHSVRVATFGQNVLCILDSVIPIVFRAPRAYKRRPDGTTDTTVFSDMPSSGNYMGFDTRSTKHYTTRWDALLPASGDCFYWDSGPLAVQTPPAGTYTPTTTSSGESWFLTGAVTASKNGILLPLNAVATFDLARPYGILCTQWGSGDGGLVFRHVDRNNYYYATSTKIGKIVNGSLLTFHTFATPLQPGDRITLRNWPDSFRVYVNGFLVANYSASNHRDGHGIGFRNMSGSTEWPYIAFQPWYTSPTL